MLRVMREVVNKLRGVRWGSRRRNVCGMRGVHTGHCSDARDARGRQQAATKVKC